MVLTLGQAHGNDRRVRDYRILMVQPRTAVSITDFFRSKGSRSTSLPIRLASGRQALEHISRAATGFRFVPTLP